MDHTEDLSARVLLKHILSTETPRTPVTRSVTEVLSRSRRSKKDAGAQTPQNILRRSLKHKIRESITRKSLPATTRRKTNTPAPASLAFDDGDTPRNILRNILLTEPVKSPIVHETAASEEPQLPSTRSSITRKRPSTDLSGLDLPDLTIGNVASTAKGLRRKRPRRSLNVTAFEKRLKDGDDVEVENEESRVEHSSLSLSSSTSLNLKTPFLDVHTEKRGLQRRVSKRRKITEEEFGAAVNNRQVGAVSSFVPGEQGLGETTYSEGFTLGLSKLSEPDITTDIVNCNTALYAQSDAITSNFSMVATQDKPTVMASQLQRQMEEMEEVEKSKLGKEKVYRFLTEEEVEPQDEVQKSTAEDQPKDSAAMSKSEEGVTEIQTSVRQDTPKSEDRMGAQTDDESHQTEKEALTSSQSEEEEVVAHSLSEVGEDAVDSQTEHGDGGVDFQHEEEVAAMSLSDFEGEEAAPDSQSEEVTDSLTQTGEDDAVDSQEDVKERSQSEEEEDVVESQTEHELDEKQEEGEQGSEQAEHNLEHINRRAYRSEGGLITAVIGGGDVADTTEEGWSDGKSKAHSAIDLHSYLEMGNDDSSQPHTGIPDLAESSAQGQKDVSYTTSEPDADKENHVNQLKVMPDAEDGGHSRGASPEEDFEQEEISEDEEDDEENEEFSCKTPAFVREKINFFHTDPEASASLPKIINTSSTSEGLPATKPMQVRQRKKGPTKKEPGLTKNYLMGVFKHFAKTKVSADVYPVLKEIMDKFFDRLAEDLETYAHHAKRSTIEFEDAVLLLKRQGYVNDKVPVEVLIEKYLRMDQRRILIPIATSGNVVIPNKR